VKRAALLALALAGCATVPQRSTVPEPPRLRCASLGVLPFAPDWFMLACTFTGDTLTVPQAPPVEFPMSLGES
jgi:hypothetical protein